MRKLIYVPVIHTFDEACLGDHLDVMIDGVYAKIDEYIDRGEDTEELYGKANEDVHFLDELRNEMKGGIDGIVERYWNEVEKEMDNVLREPKGVLVFQDGMCVEEGEIEKAVYDLADDLGSRNGKALKRLLEGAAVIKKTEDYVMLDESSCLGDQLSSGKISELTYDLKMRLSIDKRDRYVASRINEELKDGIAILFIGTDHRTEKYLDDDIEVMKIYPFDVSLEFDEFLDRTKERHDTKMREITAKWNLGGQ